MIPQIMSNAMRATSDYRKQFQREEQQRSARKDNKLRARIMKHFVDRDFTPKDLDEELHVSREAAKKACQRGEASGVLVKVRLGIYRHNPTPASVPPSTESPVEDVPAPELSTEEAKQRIELLERRRSANLQYNKQIRDDHLEQTKGIRKCWYSLTDEQREQYEAFNGDPFADAPKGVRFRSTEKYAIEIVDLQMWLAGYRPEVDDHSPDDSGSHHEATDDDLPF